MRFKGAGHMAIVALRILPFIGHVYALDLDVNSQGKRLDAGIYVLSFRRLNC